MATKTVTATATSTATAASSTPARMRMDGTDARYGDWRDDLLRDGYAVVKGAIPRERALEYADKMYSLIESL